MPRRIHRFVLLAALAVAACSSPISTPTDASMPATDATMDAAVMQPADVPGVDTPGVDVVAHGYTQTIGPITLAGMQEETVCVIRRLGNVNAEYLRRIHSTLTQGSHHLIFYRAAETAEQPDPFPCSGFSGIQSISMIDSPMLIAQQLDATLQMPDGVGMNLGANQMVRIELHAINLTPTPITVTGTVTLDTVEQTSFVIPADVMFWGPWNFSLPAHETSTQGFFHTPLSNIHIFALTSHTHHLGTLATINLATDPSGTLAGVTDSMELHRSTNWSDPPLTVFDPPLTMPNSQTGLHLNCTYNNTTAGPVNFGESFNDEMCFMWAYYYPAPRGTQVCASNLDHTDGGVLCFPP